MHSILVDDARSLNKPRVIVKWTRLSNDLSSFTASFMFTACSHALLTSVINRRKQPGMRHRPEPVRPARHRVNVAGLRDLMTFHRWHSSLSSITDHNLITRCTMWELISLTSPGHGHMRYRRMNHAYSSYEPQPSKILAFVQFYRHKLYWYRPINSRECHVHLLKRKVCYVASKTASVTRYIGESLWRLYSPYQQELQ